MKMPQAARLVEHRITSICAMLGQRDTFDVVRDVQQEVKVQTDFSRLVTSISVSIPTETVRFGRCGSGQSAWTRA